MNNNRNHRRGIVLLVVLGMLAFLSVLVVTYVVFTSRSRQSAFAIANSEYRQPMPREILDDAMMKLLRGTNNVNDAFYGEDLLSDLFGRTGAIRISGAAHDTISGLDPSLYSTELPYPGILSIGNSFIKLPYQIPGLNFAALANTELAVDDFFAGRIITFNEGPLKNHSFRILRSTGERNTTPPEEYVTRFSLYFEVDPNVEVVPDGESPVTIGELLNTSQAAVAKLFYNASDVAYQIRLNPSPLNGLGIGFDGENLNESHLVNGLPLAFQPKGISDQDGDGMTSKLNDYAIYGDFDEPYDAPDFQNYFLAHRYVDDADEVQIIPSFHRPALINYIVNQYDLSSITPMELQQLTRAIDNATFRPIPWPSLNPRFTGGNTNFALRSPNTITDPENLGHIARLDQLLKALIQGPWDVDNDGDGVPDSVWIDLGLPLVTSPEGKLLRPMVAALIEDTGGRIHINAHGNSAQLRPDYQSQIIAPWGNNPNTTTNIPARPFRGLGYGPAEIFMPAGGEVNTGAALFTDANRLELLRARYRHGASPLSAVPISGTREHDLLDRILTGTRPGTQLWASGAGFSQDPWGRGGIGVSRSGRLYAALSGTELQALDTSVTPPLPQVDETNNDPYEMDPTGRLAGDSPYTFAEFDALMRNIDWDRDILPNRLRNSLAESLTDNPELHRLLTTRSVSLDVPAAIRPSGERTAGSGTTPVPLTTIWLERLNFPHSTPAELEVARERLPTLIGPELALGRKLDVNRPFGNGSDDNGNGVIDEPRETLPLNSTDPSLEVQNTAAFPAVKSGAPAPTALTFGDVAPNYTFDLTAVTGRQLLARNLYVLMMAFSGDGYEFPMRDSSVILPVTKIDEFRARKLAQWAVNVVDYRDSDAIMTLFPYDPKPFDTNGWAPTTDFVWGVESPELIFQESLALHDVRVKDTKLEGGNSGKLKGDTPPDDGGNTDSIRIPQGSLFLELYNPRARIDTGAGGDAETQVAPVAAPPRELYHFDIASNQYVLDLARTAPARTDADGNAISPRMPVWRIAFTKPHYENAPGYAASTIGSYPANDTPEESDPESMRETFQDTASFELAAPEELGVTDAPEALAIDRVAFFAPGLDSTAVATELADVDRPEQVFFNFLNTTTALLPEQYLVLAPRTTTHLGSQTYSATGPPVAPSPQNFEINTAGAYFGLVHTNTTGVITTPDTNTQTQQALPMVIAAARDQLMPANGGSWVAPVAELNTKLPEGVGLNVSEPLPGADYYPEPNFQLRSTDDDFPLKDSYVDYVTPATSQAKDDPVDLSAEGPIADLTVAWTGEAEPAEPFLGTQERFCTAFLQRLADPTLPHQSDPALPFYNPYRSVDWISIDLTVFSGEESESTIDVPLPDDADPEYAGSSRQRDGKDADEAGTNILFSYETTEPPTVPLGASANYFSIDFSGAINPTSGMYDTATARQTFNHLNTDFGVPISGPNRGQPQIPFALHEWLNRPFATPHEIMMVPATSQGRLFQEFTTALAANPYDPGTPGPAADSIAQFKAPFGHLLNFFQSDQVEGDASQFYRVFDYIDTRPPFRGEVDAVNPMRLLTSASGNDFFDAARNQFVNAFPAPFNFFSDNRREGEINLNTVTDFPVWTGLMFGHLTPTERMAPPKDPTNPFSFQHFRTSRRGYPLPSSGGTVWDGTNPQPGPYNYDPNSLDPKYPTTFAGVYRPNVTAGLAPEVSAGADVLRRINGGSATEFSPIDSGLLRQGVDVATGDASADPMFGRNGAGEEWRNRDRNAFFRYQTLMRMPNLVTEQSQVFIVRLTLGYFEVDAATLQTGAEYKSELGQNERYQATFMIDRSIPVAYEPGEDRNVRDSILYQRIAE